MEKKLFKLGTIFIGAIILNEVVTRTPYLIGVLYDSVFGILGFSSFLVVLFLFVIELIAGKKLNIDKKKFCFIGIIIASLIGLLILFGGKEMVRDSYEDLLPERSREIVLDVDFAEQLHPQKIVNLIGQGGISDTMKQWLFSEYYFGDKSVIISKEFEQEWESILLQYITKVSVPPEKIEWREGVYATNISLNEILEYPHWDVWDTYFVLDDYWETTDCFVILKMEDKNVVCSKELIEKDFANGEGKIPSVDEIDTYDLLTHKIENQYFDSAYYFKQIAILCLMMVLGLIVTISFWGEKFPILAVFIGFPIGAAEWCVLGTFYTLVGIKYSIFSMIFILTFINGGIVLLYRKKYGTINWNIICNWTMLLVGVAVFFVYLKISYCTYDSLVKCAMGYRLAKYGTLQDILAYVAPYGMLEPMIMSIGYLLGCDYVYGFYPMMMVSGLGIMFASNYYLYKSHNNSVPIYIVTIGSILLITNNDFALSTFYVLAHGPIAVYILLLVIFIIMRKQVGIEFYGVVIFLTSSMIILSRIEGAIYALFILISSIAIEDELLDLKKTIIGVSLLIIIWNMGQICYIGDSGNPLFWTPTRGIMLIFASVFASILVFIMKMDNKFFIYVRRNLNCIIFTSVFLVTLLASVSFCRDMALVNLPIFVSHFSNNVVADTNAGAFWSFVLLLVPNLITGKKNKMTIYSLSLILGNIFLIYFICLFRDGAPIRFGFYDSARRTIMQFIPMTLWLIANCYQCDKNRAREKNAS